MMRKENHSRPILRLFSFRQAAPHGITCLCLLLLSPVVPFAAAQSEAGPPPNPYAFNAKFSPSMAIIIVVLISAFFFMGFFSIYIRQCTEVRDGRSVRPVIGGTGRSRIGPRGLDPAVIEMFPTFLYSVVKGLKIGKGTLECAVCLNEFEDDETLRLLPKCDHVFHPECIDAWLASHTTCPVCRANLVPEPGEVAVATIQIPYSNGETDEENSRSHIGDSPNQVLLRVTEDQNRDLQAPDVKNNCQIPFQNRPPRSGSIRTRFSGKFPRSHSTGHSVVQPGENCERFTLRLPEDIRKQIVNGSLSRTTSCIAFPTEGSSRRGYRNSWEGSSRGKNYQYQQFGRFDRKAKSDRWTFSMAPPFFSRTLSVKSPKVAADAEGSVTSKTFLTTVKSPFDCLSPKTDGAGQSSARPPV
ncbi:hypothetical protein HHK36_003953 [Tetracentron sinense]|uniref:RING-type E3 ubiquitin transferase n=1 Tax=Tetracentron sinense TaxID=13715 RepID=A0A834ZP73_TETSI|nr:hypothetical protein HHK36_003953 [Tetracentron sinense]